jgi:hypothetical protein
MTGNWPMSVSSMEAAMNLQPHRSPARGSDLLLHHCGVVGGDDAPRVPARIRLREALGGELADLLVGALTPGVQGLRVSSSP